MKGMWRDADGKTKDTMLVCTQNVTTSTSKHCVALFLLVRMKIKCTIILPSLTFSKISLHLLDEILVVHRSILVWPLQTQA